MESKLKFKVGQTVVFANGAKGKITDIQGTGQRDGRITVRLFFDSDSRGNADNWNYFADESLFGRWCGEENNPSYAQHILYIEPEEQLNSDYDKRKADKGKLLFSLLTRGLALPLRAVAAVLTYGAQKYEPESWKAVPDAARRYEDAMDRHLNQWKAGEQFDDESGLHHMAHVACNALFLLWFIITHKDSKGIDFFAYKEVKKHAG